SEPAPTRPNSGALTQLARNRPRLEPQDAVVIHRQHVPKTITSQIRGGDDLFEIVPIRDYRFFRNRDLLDDVKRPGARVLKTHGADGYRLVPSEFGFAKFGPNPACSGY